MKNVGIVTNASKDIGFEYTKEVYHWLLSRGCNPIVFAEAGRSLDGEDWVGDMDSLCARSDFIVVLGGDGTILQAARESAVYEVPLIGINLGTLGYLTDVEKGECFTALEKTLEGAYVTERRMMLQAKVSAGGEEIGVSQELIALNDVCILRGFQSKMIEVDLFVNDQFIDRYKADGMIVATPTGSTAYNLSAGGPILKPDIELIAVTPVCPHKMYSRSSVISSKDLVRIKITEGSGIGGAVLTMDGQEHIPLKPGWEITIGRSDYYTTVIRTNDLGFYDILRQKFFH